MYLIRPPAMLKWLYPEAVWKEDSNTRKVYLTFDDGPCPGVTDLVLEILEKEKISATFFCIGKNIEKHRELFDTILNNGHRTGNHTYDHCDGWKTSPDVYFESVERCNKIHPSSLFRPPYGRLRLSQYRQLKNKYKIVMWDLLSGDFDSGITPQKCVRNVTEHVSDGSVIVFHDSSKAAKNMLGALPEVIKNLKEKGYAFGKLKE